MSASTITPEVARELALKSLALAFPGVGFVSTFQAAEFFNVSEIHLKRQIAPDGHIHLGQYSIPTVKFGVRRIVPVAGLIDFVATSLLGGGATTTLPDVDLPPSPESAAVVPKRKGPGRRTNREKLEASKRQSTWGNAVARA